MITTKNIFKLQPHYYQQPWIYIKNKHKLYNKNNENVSIEGVYRDKNHLHGNMIHKHPIMYKILTSIIRNLSYIR